jgi:hypothetical protein
MFGVRMALCFKRFNCSKNAFLFSEFERNQRKSASPTRVKSSVFSTFSRTSATTEDVFSSRPRPGPITTDVTASSHF